MNTTHPALSDMRSALALLEEELRALGWWQNTPPSAQALASTEPFCVDTLTFTEWLQWVYTPKMHAFMHQTGQLPATSGLSPIAEEAWKNTAENTARLLDIIALLDALITGNHHAQLRRLITLH